MVKLIYQKIHNLISDNKFSEILTGSAWTLLANVVATGMGLVTTSIITRIYGADEFGIVALLNSFFIFATIFTVLGTNTSILRLIQEHIAKYSPSSAFIVYKKIQYMVAGASIIIGGLLFIGSKFIAQIIFSKPRLNSYFALAAVFVIFKSLMILNQQAVRGLRLIRAFAFMQLLPQLSKLIILLLITFIFFHKDNPVYALFASFAITALTGAWIMQKAFRQKSDIRDAIHPTPVKDILSISFPMLMAATMSIIISETGVLMLGMYRPEIEVGYYAAAVKLSSLAALVLTAVNSMAAPKFAELYHSDKIEELFYIAKKSAKLIFWMTMPILLGFIIFGKIILHILFGAEFTIAYPVLVLLVIGQFINSISGATGYFMNMTGRQNTFRNIVCIAAAINIGLSILLIPRYGIYGAATAGMIGLMIWNLSALWYIKFKFGKSTGYLPLLG